jgi:DNA primase
VSEITKEEYLRLSSIIINLIPEFLKGHEFSSKRFPSYEQHSLHFIKRIEGKIIDFIHLLRINFKQSREAAELSRRETLSTILLIAQTSSISNHFLYLYIKEAIILNKSS